MFRKFLLLRLIKSNPKSYLIQIMNSSVLIQVGIIATKMLYKFAPKFSEKVSILASNERFLNSLYDLHKLENIDYKSLIKQVKECEFDYDPNYIFDEVIIGSGPGGSIAAYLSAQKNKRVLLVEEGAPKSKVDQHSLLQLINDFRDSGQEIVLSNPLIPFAQGSLVGGSSEINSGLYHRLPIHKQEEWLRVLSVPKRRWDYSQDKIESIVKITKQSPKSLGVYLNSPLKIAAQEMGWECHQIPRWRHYNENSFDHYGMVETFQKLSDSNLLILSSHKALVVIPGVNVQSIKLNGSKCNHEIMAKRVTISCGTVETPRLLVRSKLINHKDFNFGFHAMSRIIGVFPENVNDLYDIDPHQAWTENYEHKFGVAVSTPAFLQATLASLGSKTKLDYEKSLVFYASSPMQKSGKFYKVGTQVYPAYKFNNKERASIDSATKMLTEGLKRTPAIKIITSSHKPSLSTVHIFGSMPLGNSKLDLRGTFKNIGHPNIRVCDASLFPSAPLVNPQGPLMHLAYLLTLEWLKND